MLMMLVLITSAFHIKKKYQDHIPCGYAYKVGCIDDKFSKKIVLCRGKNVINMFNKMIFNEWNYCKKNYKKVF